MLEAAAENQAQHRRWLTYAAAAVAVVFLVSMLRATEGHFVPQLADLYLICQYARAFAEGHPFQYNPGEAPSTGATSLLFTVVLGIADRLGLRGERLVAFAIIGGATCYVFTVRLAHRLAGRLGSPGEALLAGALVVGSGPVVWGFLYGSDTAPFMLLFLWLTERLFAGSVGGVAVAATLLALTRPEGLPLGVGLAAASPWLWPEKPGKRWLLAPVAAGTGVLVLYRLLTGYWVSTSVADKALLMNYGFTDTLALVCEYLVDVLRGVLLGLYPSPIPIGFAKGWAPYYFPPLALVLVILALARLDPERRRLAACWSLIVAVLVVLVAPTLYMGVHFNRYLMWAFPAVHVFVGLGVGAAARRLAAEDSALARRLFLAGAGLVTLLGALSTARFAALYGDQAGDVYRRDVAAAQWISRQLPRGATIANLATSVEYLTGHRSVNLHGVTSPAFFGNRPAERELGMFEAMGRLGPADRPEYLLTTVDTHESSPILQELVATPPLFRTSSFGDDIVVYRMRFDALGRNRRLYSPAVLEQVRGLRMVDELNIGDSQAERAHQYSVDSHAGALRLHGTVRAAAYSGGERVIDGGRAVFGGETFEVAAERGKDLLVVLRTTRSLGVRILRASVPVGGSAFDVDLPEAVMALTVEGRPYRHVRFSPQAGWDEHVIRVAGAELGAARTRLELRGNYTSFYYWFFQ